MKKKKLLLYLIIIVLIIVISPNGIATAENNNDEVSKQLNSEIINELNNIDFSNFNNIIDELNKNDSNIFSIDNIKTKIYKIISGEASVSYDSLIKTLFYGIAKTITKYLPVLVAIIGIGIMSSLMGGINNKIFDKSNSNIINVVCVMVVIGLITAVVGNLINKTGQSIRTMVNSIDILFPILLTLMATIGAGASAGTFQPIVAVISTYVGTIFYSFILPLFLLSFVISIVSNLSNHIKLEKFHSFISSLFKWSVGIVFTLFFAIFSIHGIVAGSFDSIGIRTTKFTIKNSVPIMGGYLSDGMDLILASGMLIKNAVGLVGVLIIISTILTPILEVVIFSLLLKLASAILEPLGSSRISNMLHYTSKSIGILSTTIIAVGFMYLICVGLIMSVTNVVGL